MRLNQALIDLSSSMTVYTDKRGHETDQFKWNNIQKFMYFAFTFASSSSNFDIFSHVYENVRLLDFLVCELIMGMPYMFMDFFIRQFTRNLDFNKSLNPLLKGISFAILLQSALWAMLHASDLADSIRFLASSLRTEPSWSKCQKNITCISFKQMIIQCRANNFTKFNVTSAHINYLRSFSYLDKNVLTTRFFASALVWIFNFFCTTVTAETLLKIFKVTYLWRFFSTLVMIFVIICSKKQDAAAAFAEILDVTAPTSFAMAMDHVTYAYGIGFVGVYDFETMSPYTMVDNAVVMFTIIFTVSAFARSLIVKILYLVLTSCVQVEISITPHYLLFAILPYSTEFFYGHKLYIIYIFVNLMLATTAYLAMLTLSISKLLHSEFQSVKSMYIVGLLCFLGFSLSVPITIQSMTSSSRIQGLVYGLKCTVLYLGGFRVAIVMWVYGVRRFSTDIHFWLDFKPTKFWTICWMFLPVLLFSFFINRVYELTRMPDFTKLIAAVSWILFSLLLVAIFHVRTVAKYIIRNNIAKAFLSSAKYGPPEPEDRKRRRIFSETIQLRRCVHNCNILDNSFDCNHLPLRFRSKSRVSETSLSENSLEPIYESPLKMRKSSVVETIW